MKLLKKLAPVLLLLLFAANTWAQREIKIEGHDNLRFTVETIKASPGEQLKITLTTVSNINDKSMMAHNWVLLKKGTDGMNFVNKGLQHEDNDFIDPALESKVIAETKMLGDGETDSIVFNVPEEKGTYEYVCTFRAHYQAGMKGKLIVE
ncbi:plastocyanin/azurin family copper-binding protein [uncultured Draconibacterium sp.]|uniref:plastocyanin/azurin family copper-binding protein n=1 Tax=uncultured Draconibacterium sp. TaxID=1573823 RepID=UPI0025F4F158|nr:plastocyanin/azurin family copper-binding protein [uncultured Draconibacterium sp.]